MLGLQVYRDLYGGFKTRMVLFGLLGFKAVKKITVFLLAMIYDIVYNNALVPEIYDDNRLGQRGSY